MRRFLARIGRAAASWLGAALCTSLRRLGSGLRGLLERHRAGRGLLRAAASLARTAVACKRRVESSERLARFQESTEWAFVRLERIGFSGVDKLRPHAQRLASRFWSRARLWSGVEVGMILLLTVSLAGLVSPAFGGETASERDLQRLAMLKETQRALEHFHNEHGAYPSTDGEWWGDPENFGCFGYDSEGYIPGLVPRYLESLPRDPNPAFPTHDAGWLYMSDGVDYKLVVFKTPESYPKSNPYLDAIRPDTAWQVSTPGAVLW